MLDIQINAGGLDPLEPAMEKALQAGLDRVAGATLEAKHAQQDAGTYQQPPPPKSKPRRREAGGWYGQQEIQKPDDHTRVVAGVGDSEQFEERLANLPTGADGINRSNPAAERAAAEIESQAAQLFERAFEEALQGIV